MHPHPSIQAETNKHTFAQCIHSLTGQQLAVMAPSRSLLHARTQSVGRPVGQFVS